MTTRNPKNPCVHPLAKLRLSIAPRVVEIRPKAFDHPHQIPLTRPFYNDLIHGKTWSTNEVSITMETLERRLNRMEGNTDTKFDFKNVLCSSVKRIDNDWDKLSKSKDRSKGYVQKQVSRADALQQGLQGVRGDIPELRLPREVKQRQSLPEEFKELQSLRQEVKGIQSLIEEFKELRSLREEVMGLQILKEEDKELQSLRQEVLALNNTVRQQASENQTLQREVKELRSLQQEVEGLQSLRGEVKELRSLRQEVVALSNVREIQTLRQEVNGLQTLQEEVTELQSLREIIELREQLASTQESIEPKLLPPTSTQSFPEPATTRNLWRPRCLVGQLFGLLAAPHDFDIESFVDGTTEVGSNQLGVS